MDLTITVGSHIQCGQWEGGEYSNDPFGGNERVDPTSPANLIHET